MAPQSWEPIKWSMQLSVIIPVYNERATVSTLLQRVLAAPYEKEVIIVDDSSTDGTWEALHEPLGPEVKLVRHPHNQGKGAALRTGLAHATGDVVLFQDADLEYDPQDYPRLVEPILQGEATVVYGYRIWERTGVVRPPSYYGNRFLTLVTNLLYGARLRDMEVCYKAFRADVVKGLALRAHRFEIEPEVTAKVLKAGHTITQVPISYRRRSIQEGKKIRWRDGLTALATLFRERVRR